MISASEQSPIVGIDLGTTNSLVAVMDLTGPRILGGHRAERGFRDAESGEVIVGDRAREMLITHPERTVYSVKRLMGRGVDDVQEELKLFPFHMARRQRVGHSSCSSATRRHDAARSLGAHSAQAEAGCRRRTWARRSRKAVITVPAYFNDAQRQATKDAGRIAGLEVLRLVNEPTAAALAYGLDKRKDGIVAVYDFGGGTFDISILRLHDGIFEVLATNGDTHLGGDDIDNLLLRIALEDIASEWGEDVSTKSDAVQLLRRAVIQAKEQLSFVPAADDRARIRRQDSISARSTASCSTG